MNKFKGVTLIELLLYIGLLSFVLAAAVGFYGLVLQLRSKTFAITEVEAEGNNISKQIDILTQGYLDIVSPLPGETSPNLEFISESGNMEFISYENGNLIYVDSSGNNHMVNSNSVYITDFIFRNLSVTNQNDSINFEYSISKTVNPVRNEFNYSQVFRSAIK